VLAPQLPKARVLLADDNADMRRYVARLLSDIYEVVAVADGQEALDAVRAAPPDLVLSDVMMPRLDGFGLVRALRADERTRTLPIILLSARAGEEAAVESLGTGADDYLVKPFSARELLARVRTHVELARERRAWESELERRVKERTAELRLAQQAALQQEHASASCFRSRKPAGRRTPARGRLPPRLPTCVCCSLTTTRSCSTLFGRRWKPTVM
jgi:DNA-binding response OmpR family regulator